MGTKPTGCGHFASAMLACVLLAQASSFVLPTPRFVLPTPTHPACRMGIYDDDEYEDLYEDEAAVVSTPITWAATAGTPRITMFTLDRCSYCGRAKILLSEKGWGFREISV